MACMSKWLEVQALQGLDVQAPIYFGLVCSATTVENNQDETTCRASVVQSLGASHQPLAPSLLPHD